LGNGFSSGGWVLQRTKNHPTTTYGRDFYGAGERAIKRKRDGGTKRGEEEKREGKRKGLCCKS
jgi:hypothetical protein